MIKISKIIKAYGVGDNKAEILKGISLEIADGDFAVILGASGSGKSTFLNVISGLERPDSGIVAYDNVDITKLSEVELTRFRKCNIGFIFQQYYLLPNMNVEKNVRMGADLANNKDYHKVCSFNKSIDEIISYVIAKNGIGNLSYKELENAKRWRYMILNLLYGKLYSAFKEASSFRIVDFRTFVIKYFWLIWLLRNKHFLKKSRK